MTITVMMVISCISLSYVLYRVAQKTAQFGPPCIGQLKRFTVNVTDCDCSFRFWPVIDDALRKASLERGVRVRILASQWNHTKHDMVYFLRSLSDISGAMKADVQVVSAWLLALVVE